MKARRNVECAFGVWKCRWRSMDKTGGALCYSPGRTCRLAVATMVLHNICIDHGLQWETDIPTEEDYHIDPADTTSLFGTMVRQPVITDYFN